MNLVRLRELLAAWQSGAIREAELNELRDALPELIRRHVALRIDARYCAQALLVAIDYIEREGVDENPDACDEHRLRANQVLESLS